jgi:hypothetical protein
MIIVGPLSFRQQFQNFQKFDKMKNDLIYAKVVKVLYDTCFYRTFPKCEKMLNQMPPLKCKSQCGEFSFCEIW